MIDDVMLLRKGANRQIVYTWWFLLRKPIFAKNKNKVSYDAKQNNNGKVKIWMSKSN